VQILPRFAGSRQPGMRLVTTPQLLVGPSIIMPGSGGLPLIGPSDREVAWVPRPPNSTWEELALARYVLAPSFVSDLARVELLEEALAVPAAQWVDQAPMARQRI
jgi:hypothetical protein